MDDVLAHVMLAIGDIDLLPADPVMITFRGRRRAKRRQIGARLRFRQIHRTGPFTGIQLWKIGRLLGVVADNLKGVNGALGQKLTQRKPHIGAVPHLVHGCTDALRQTLPAIVG